MKRMMIAAAAALSFVAPLAVDSAAADDHREWRDDRRDDYRHNHREWHDDRRDDRRHYREGYRDGRHDDHYADHWDRRRYNGYYYRDRWYLGPPPAAYYADPYYRPGYRAWRKGDYLPPFYRQSYVVVDYRHHHHLYAPPRGCHWVRDDRGDYLLVGVATGLILGLAFGG